jgi:hypothetical protein
MLRALLDRELTAAEEQSATEHVRGCASCQTRSEAIQRRTHRVAQLLQATAAGPADAAGAYNRYRQRFGSSSDTESHLRAFWKRPLWGGLAAACALGALLSLSPAQTWAQRILAMLRVEKVAVVPLDLQAITPTGNQGSGKLLAQLVSDKVIVTMDPGKPVKVESLAAANQQAGFQIRTLDAAGSPASIRISNEAAFHMTLDRDRMQAILDQAGRSDIQIPASVDGSTVAVHVPKSVQLEYGNCDGKGLPEGCMAFMQVPSPTVSVPPNLNIAALAEAGLQFAGMSAAEAHSFTQTVDWSSTLLIPIPRNGSSYRPVSVDGSKGTLVEETVRSAYSLVWLKNGIIYMLCGRGNSSQGLAAAASLD